MSNNYVIARATCSFCSTNVAATSRAGLIKNAREEEWLVSGKDKILRCPNRCKFGAVIITVTKGLK